MSRYYFHIIDGGRTVPDDEGMELADFLAAQAEAMASARDLALAGAGAGHRTVQIVNAAGDVLDWVPVYSH